MTAAADDPIPLEEYAETVLKATAFRPSSIDEARRTGQVGYFGDWDWAAS
jgi:hypothetical protein